VLVVDPVRRLVAGELDHALLAERPGSAQGVGRVGPERPPAGPVGELEQVLEPVRVRARERQLPDPPTALELDAALTAAQVVEQSHPPERRVGEGELDGVDGDLRANRAVGTHRGPRIVRSFATILTD
jgi:hypothetical protein